jgi:hypothetical protein
MTNGADRWGMTIDRNESMRLERDGVAFLVRALGLDTRKARELLRAADVNVDSAIDTWLEAGEQLTTITAAGDRAENRARKTVTEDCHRRRLPLRYITVTHIRMV